MSGGNITFQTIPTGDPALQTPVDGVAVEVDPIQVRQFVRGVINGTRSTDIVVPRPSAPSTTAAQRGRVAPTHSTRPTEAAQSTQPTRFTRSTRPTYPGRFAYTADPTSTPAPTITAGGVPYVD